MAENKRNKPIPESGMRPSLYYITMMDKKKFMQQLEKAKNG